MIKNISGRIGLTPTETKVLIFLLVVFLFGYGVKYFYLRESIEYKEFDYSEEDSVFNSITGYNKNLLQKKLEPAGKKVDYKREVLDLDTLKFQSNKKKIIPPELRININTAGIEEFTGLPGIGEKTAEKIIIFRKKIGRFRKLNELLKVKGIGNSKYSNIKKYIYIE